MNANSDDICSIIGATDASLNKQAAEEETIDSLETDESDEDESHSSGDQKQVVEPAALDSSSNEDDMHLSRNAHTGTRVSEPAEPAARAAIDESEEASSNDIPEDRRYSQVFMPPPLRPPPSAPSLDLRTSSSSHVKVGKCPLSLPPPLPSGGGRATTTVAPEICAGVTRRLPEDKEKPTQNNVQQFSKMFAHLDFAKTMRPPAKKSNKEAPATKRKSTVSRGSSVQEMFLPRPSAPKTRRLPSKPPNFARLSSARPLPSPRLAIPRNTIQLPPCSSTGPARRAKDMFQEDLRSALTHHSLGNSLRIKGSQSKVFKLQNRPAALSKISASLLFAKDAVASEKPAVWDMNSFPQAYEFTEVDAVSSNLITFIFSQRETHER